ncbi:hypothetical protein [Ottowia sp.]|uniref:hypothetical protein n=1 Tax=Ottowia sp. TaxID=1898956 RepID=UPI003A8A840E
MSNTLDDDLRDDVRADSLVLSALLHADGALSGWALICTALTMLALLAMPWPADTLLLLWLAVGVLALAERYVRFRLMLDQQLFQQLGEGRLPSLAHMDGGLQRLGLRRAAPRPWADRVRGTRRLLYGHLGLVLVQTALVMVCGIGTSFLNGY